MKRIVKSLSIVALILAVLVNPLMAEEYDKTYHVSYDGDEFTSDFSAEDISELLSDIQPGDSAEVVFVLKNASDKDVDLYMDNSIRDAFGDFGGGYDYSLTYAGSTDRDLLDQTLGGDGGKLEDLNENVKDYFYLERFTPGQEAEITLSIALDGETQGNVYQTTNGTIRVNFAAEQVAQENPPVYIYVPNTGDNSNLMLYFGMEAVALILLAYVCYRYYQYKREA